MEKSGIKTLKDLSTGVAATVVAVRGTGAITRRLMEMGVVPGVLVEKVKYAPFGDPIQIRVRGYHLALRVNEAESIEVSG